MNTIKIVLGGVALLALVGVFVYMNMRERQNNVKRWRSCVQRFNVVRGPGGGNLVRLGSERALGLVSEIGRSLSNYESATSKGESGTKLELLGHIEESLDQLEKLASQNNRH